MRTIRLKTQGDIMLKKTLFAAVITAVAGVLGKLIVARVRSAA